MKENSYILGLGAAKAGTTALSTLMFQHPEIYKPIKGKELHYFDENFDKGKSFYFNQWSDEAKKRLDFTPSYIFDPACRDRILKTLSNNCKFIVILRNPIERAFSHYCHAIKNWHRPEFRPRGYPIENLSFMDALLGEENRLASGKYHIRHQSYFSKGLYSKQIKWYLKVFNPKDFQFIIFEHFINDHVEHLKSLYEWLNIDSDFAETQTIKKENSQTFGNIPEDAKIYLKNKYMSSIEDLETLLNKDLSIWK